ncbi:fructosamine-3-kinase-like [Pomacea canaliculata]|nr:fructosamine-3-kinase-like [Pomacea canaliculata]XP_025105574.1 fructosamine-3-kinase-like [Pomacea canaliculata]
MWRDTWQEYFIGDILQPLMSGLQTKYSDRTLSEKWAWLQRYIPKVFEKESLTPAINHGDLCLANFGQTEKGPVVFDPSVLYGHCQFDLILSYLEEAFDEQFFQEYHKIIPKSSRCNDFLLVYEFFYHAVMWYHIDDVKYQCSTHSSADRVKDMLQKQYITT